MIYELIICILAGCGAGISTGFAGLSAAVFITPMLVSFLDVPTYEAVGIALASDVLASAVSAYTYGKNSNIDLKRGKNLLFSVLLFAIIGSIIAFIVSASKAGNTLLGFWSIIATLFLGINFILHPEDKKTGIWNKLQGNSQTLIEFICGAYIGIICGFQGTGGGLMMLLIMTVVMNYEYKKAVGTSVLIMTFTALIGAISHFYMNGVPDGSMLVTCILSTLVFARIGAVIANKISVKAVHLFTGFMLAGVGAIMLVVNIVDKLAI